MSSDSEVTAQKRKKRKIPIVYRSDDSEEKSNTEEEKRKRHSSRMTVTPLQAVNPNTNESFATKAQKMI